MPLVNHDVILISSDDDSDGERNLDERLESEHDGGYNVSEHHQLDRQKENDVKKSNEDEHLVNCDEGCDNSDPSNQGGNDFQEQSLYECKTYLRKHGMRVTGTKEECIQRIKEHESLKDGKGEVLHPRSSFSIDCSGDVCKGDVLLFRQNIYNSQRDIIGSRTVAGRIAKESYGASLQQHTFSVEVLWSKWFKKLEPLSILLIKGRNLYRFGTYRQPWENEAERLKVLAEKHKRGRAARLARTLREKRCALSGDVRDTKQLCKKTTARSLAFRFQMAKQKSANQSTYHSNPKHSIHSYNEQGAVGHWHNNYRPPVHRLTVKEVKSHFPISSFSINCTGNACKGDIVLFKQSIHARKKQNMMVENKRTVAGRILEVLQCRSKDEHTFRIEVLWTKHSSTNLQPHSELLLRSSNLYKFGTFRQPWRNEARRSMMLKYGQPTGEQKTKKTDVDSNKKTGPSKLKSISPVKKATKGQKKRKAAARLQKKELKKSKQLTKGQKKRKAAAQLQKKELKKAKRLEPAPNPNTISGTSSMKPNPITLQNPEPHQNLNLCQNPNLNKRENPKPNTLHNSGQDPNPNTLKNPKHPHESPNPNPNTLQNLKHPHESPNAAQNQNVNNLQNLNLNPLPNSYVYSHQQTSSSSIPNDRSLMLNPAPPSGYQPPPVRCPPDQAHGGPWEQNQAPAAYYDHNNLLAQGLIALWYYYQTR